MFFERLRSFYSPIDNLHKCVGVCLESVLIIYRLQVSCDLLDLLLDAVAPGISCSEQFHLVCIELCEVKFFVLFSNGNVVESAQLLIICGCDNRFQIYIDSVVT